MNFQNRLSSNSNAFKVREEKIIQYKKDLKEFMLVQQNDIPIRESPKKSKTKSKKSKKEVEELNNEFLSQSSLEEQPVTQFEQETVKKTVKIVEKSKKKKENKQEESSKILKELQEERDKLLESLIKQKEKMKQQEEKIQHPVIIQQPTEEHTIIESYLISNLKGITSKLQKKVKEFIEPIEEKGCLVINKQGLNIYLDPSQFCEEQKSALLNIDDLANEDERENDEDDKNPIFDQIILAVTLMILFYQFSYADKTTWVNMSINLIAFLTLLYQLFFNQPEKPIQVQKEDSKQEAIDSKPPAQPILVPYKATILLDTTVGQVLSLLQIPSQRKNFSPMVTYCECLSTNKMSEKYFNLKQNREVEWVFKQKIVKKNKDIFVIEESKPQLRIFKITANKSTKSEISLTLFGSFWAEKDPNFLINPLKQFQIHNSPLQLLSLKSVLKTTNFERLLELNLRINDVNFVEFSKIAEKARKVKKQEFQGNSKDQGGNMVSQLKSEEIVKEEDAEDDKNQISEAGQIAEERKITEEESSWEEEEEEVVKPKKGKQPKNEEVESESSAEEEQKVESLQEKLQRFRYTLSKKQYDTIVLIENSHVRGLAFADLKKYPWKQLGDSRGFKSWIGPKTGNIIEARNEGVINQSVDDIILTVANVEIRNKFDKMFDRGFFVEHISDDYSIAYLRFKKQKIVQGRDFIVGSSIKDYPDGSKVLSMVSLKGYNYPLQKKTVRGEIAIGITQLIPLGKKKTRMIQSTRTKAGMKVPGWLQKFVIKGQTETMESIGGFVKREKKAGTFPTEISKRIGK